MNRDHVRSRRAYDDVTALTGDQQAYGRLALKLPFLIRSSGLAQALTFVDAKSGKAIPLLDHVAATVGEVTGKKLDRAALLREARSADDAATYLHLTHEVLHAATWYKRLSTSVLGVEPGDDGADT